MPEIVMEPGQYQYWIGPQSAQGTAAADAALTVSPAITGGSVSTNLNAGVTRWPQYSQRFWGAVRYVDSLTGAGELTCVGHPSNIGRLLRWMLGGTDTVSGAGPYTHTLATAAASQWLTIVRKVGVNEGTGAGAPRIERYNDCRMTQLVIQGSTADKTVTITPTFIVADPAETRTTSPAATIPVERPFVYTDGTGAFKFSTNTGTAVVNPDTTSFTLTISEPQNPAPGDGIVPLGFTPGEATVTWAIEATAATAALTEYNRLIYGSATPFAAPGAKPSTALPSAGSVDIDLSYGSAGALRSLSLASSTVQFTPSGELPTSNDGQHATITFTGEATGSTPIAPVVVTGDTGAYV